MYNHKPDQHDGCARMFTLILLLIAWCVDASVYNESAKDAALAQALYYQAHYENIDSHHGSERKRRRERKDAKRDEALAKYYEAEVDRLLNATG